MKRGGGGGGGNGHIICHMVGTQIIKWNELWKKGVFFSFEKEEDFTCHCPLYYSFFLPNELHKTFLLETNLYKV